MAGWAGRRDHGDAALPLVVDLHRADRRDPTEPHTGVKFGSADAEPAGDLVRAEGDVPVEEGRQVPPAR